MESAYLLSEAMKYITRHPHRTVVIVVDINHPKGVVCVSTSAVHKTSIEVPRVVVASDRTNYLFSQAEILAASVRRFASPHHVNIHSSTESKLAIRKIKAMARTVLNPDPNVIIVDLRMHTVCINTIRSEYY